MSEISVTSSPRSDKQDIGAICDALEILAEKLDGSDAGLSREAAARWIVEHTSPTLAARISGKPLTPRMVEEWLDRFGGDHAEWNLGTKTYVIWSQGEALTVEKFRSITEQIAREYPGKEPR